MLVISDKLTTGQITFVLRVVIQILSYGGLFLIGIIILGNTPRVAPLETHDVLNRIVGKSTATITTVKWIFKRTFRRHQDPASSSPLLLALALSLCYGLFVSLSDIGFIGFHSCTVPGSSFQDFPASIKNDSDALALLSANIVNGTDPRLVKSFICDSAQVVVINENVTERICSVWHNSTYADSTSFLNLNSTDSAVLMAKNLAPDNSSKASDLDLNFYLTGASGQGIVKPTISGGIAVIPHDTGVMMFSGVPHLSKLQRVEIPKTLLLEVDIGCIPLGTLGQIDPTSLFALGKDFFIPDSIYDAAKTAKYTGPEILRDSLVKAAAGVRNVMLPVFNSSDVDDNGFYRTFNGSYGGFSWQTELETFYPPSLPNSKFSSSDLSRYVMGNCTQEINQILNVSSPGGQSLGAACGLYQLRGSFFSDQNPIRGHSELVCATTTQVNMASVTLETDGDGAITHDFTRLPSNLNIVEADYFEVIHKASGDTIYGNYDPIYRYTLTDNPSGSLNHYIFQQYSTGPTGNSFSHGTGGIGMLFPQVGSAMIGISTMDDTTLGLINTTYFSGNFSSAQVTRWAGAVGASYILNSVGYNGWAARGSQAFTIISTGGRLATCYDYRFAAGFLPLILAAIFIIIWAAFMFLKAQIRETKRLEKMYGGLSPTIVTPFFGKPPADTVLVWENGPEPHLKPAVHGTPIVGAESELLVSHVGNENYSGYGAEK